MPTRHAHDARVLPCQLDERLAEDVLVEGRQVAGVGQDAFARVWAELAGRVPHAGVLFGRLEALALGGVQVQYLGALQVLDVVEHAGQILHVVSVDGPEVSDVHALEDVLLLGGHRLQAVGEADEGLAALLVEDAHLEEQARHPEAQLVVAVAGGEVEEVLLHAAHAAVDGHVVVVEDDEQVVRRGRGVVQPLEGQSAAHASVADDGHHMAVFLPLLPGGHAHAQGGRDGVGRVSAGEGVIFALFGRGEGSDALEAPVGREGLAASCQYLVAVGLMAHVPDDAVVGCAVDVVQGYGQLHCAQAGGKVSGVARHLFDDVLPELAAHLGQLVHRQAAQVVGRGDAVQQVVCSQIRIHLFCVIACKNNKKKSDAGNISDKKLNGALVSGVD